MKERFAKHNERTPHSSFKHTRYQLSSIFRLRNLLSRRESDRNGIGIFPVNILYDRFDPLIYLASHPYVQHPFGQHLPWRRSEAQFIAHGARVFSGRWGHRGDALLLAAAAAGVRRAGSREAGSAPARERELVETVSAGQRREHTAAHLQGSTR